MLKSAVMGTFIGSIPGAEQILQLLYPIMKREEAQKTQKFGTEILEGIAAPEAGNNGVTGGALVPLLTLGYWRCGYVYTPGALIIQGLQPGRCFYRKCQYRIWPFQFYACRQYCNVNSRSYRY